MTAESDPLSLARRAIDRRMRHERRRRRRSRRLLTRIAWAGSYVLLLNLAAWFSLETPEELLTWKYFLRADKFEHLLGFLAITVATVSVLGRWISGGLLAILLMNAGLVIEMMQAFEPDRTADYADFVFDQAGVALGWIGSVAIRRRLGLHRQPGSVEVRGS